ncbi:Deoxyuridine 5'-triphosphate nucleotidohydrolase [Coemansia reversa NRRL 1564]|uniref:Deoxyuridine 5'-triphosphate nucleotidohydrolase n=1 Tax=Coemansia reversa (strain ATCC 12441 / NRRL 1564) TaxID=763665 RepID=A0A2G5BI29_COERN|nr:Deoxyuridine 5'-triphosphate nucleotidohydrolase [Coemansia reversa NRRL 1564]|eukprot:PIA18632.1 Deoxyuridine 5'-triphosphate nucleotidohydrolase [Coemansia reversa NRRL 1564]
MPALNYAQPPFLRVFRTSTAARLPTRGSQLAAGYDIYASEAAEIPGRSRGVVSTGLKIKIPLDTYARVAPRSGLAVKHGIDTAAGVIDPDYDGEVLVALFNHNDKPFQVKEGDRIAQLILERIYTPDVAELSEEEYEKIEKTERGSNGFGSTGGF